MALKRANVESNVTQRAAGLPSFSSERPIFKELLISAHPLEVIHSHVEEQCRRHRSAKTRTGKRRPCLPDNNVGYLFTTESHLTTFNKQFLVDKHKRKHLKSAKVGEIMPAHSKPSHVTNWSRTFGRASTPSDSLYTTIMPIKTDDQVNREYAEFHRGHIVSHNHHFPAEQIDRGYTKPFERCDTFGIHQGGELNGSTMKKCLAQSDERLTVVNKTWMDYAQRTQAPLGEKYEKYLYEVPDIIFGTCLREKCGMKTLPVQDDTLANSLSYLTELRHTLQKRNDFYMIDLISRLEKIDRGNTRHMQLSLILETIKKLHIRVHPSRIRRMLSNFRLIIDEGCATERVNYDHFCRLLSIQEKLPDVGQIGILPEENMYNKETTYRRFTSDLLKKPAEGPVYTRTHQSPAQKDDADVRLRELITPKYPIRIGLGPSDFNCPRDKAQMERIFERVLAKEDFEATWQRVMADQKEPQEQDGYASVNQFRAKMKKHSFK
ncbi:hypothetical protein KR054_006444 [Drosophila jambulina]|nr:hypothetical protein KR054_006444 [Drosophila jambulina]